MRLGRRQACVREAWAAFAIPTPNAPRRLLGRLAGMDHPFLTRRRELAAAQEGLALAADLDTFLAMNADDAAKMRARRDAEVPTLAVRQALARRGARLGMLLEDMDACGSALAAEHARAWDCLVAGSAPCPVDALRTAAAAAAATWRATIEELGPVEKDDDESSYSDYSDAHTVTTKSGSESESESGSDSESDRSLKKKK